MVYSPDPGDQLILLQEKKWNLSSLSGTSRSSHVPSNGPTGKMRTLRLPMLKKKTDVRKVLFRGVPNEDQLIFKGSIDPLKGIDTCAWRVIRIVRPAIIQQHVRPSHGRTRGSLFM